MNKLETLEEVKERFLTVYPKSELVASHVSYYYYYFHQTFDEKFKRNILYHPHYVTALNVYKGANLTWNDYSRTLKSSPTRRLTGTYLDQKDEHGIYHAWNI